MDSPSSTAGHSKQVNMAHKLGLADKSDRALLLMVAAQVMAHRLGTAVLRQGMVNQLLMEDRLITVLMCIISTEVDIPVGTRMVSSPIPRRRNSKEAMERRPVPMGTAKVVVRRRLHGTEPLATCLRICDVPQDGHSILSRYGSVWRGGRKIVTLGRAL
jgi:hypothetical protein